MGANKKAYPSFSSDSTIWVSGIVKSSPIYSKKSALPNNPLADLFPCFATFIPEADAIIDAAVLILNEFDRSPPVPQLSISAPLILGVILWTLFFQNIYEIFKNMITIFGKYGFWVKLNTINWIFFVF